MKLNTVRDVQIHNDGYEKGEKSGKELGLFLANISLCDKMGWLLKRQREVIDSKESRDAVTILNIMDDVISKNNPETL